MVLTGLCGVAWVTLLEIQDERGSKGGGSAIRGCSLSGEDSNGVVRKKREIRCTWAHWALADIWAGSKVRSCLGKEGTGQSELTANSSLFLCTSFV
jgi:hypothetical protein